MTSAIFLSASVPDLRQGPQYAETADTVAITAAVSALVHVTLGRRLLVWGGHPAITPMIWVVAEGLDINYGSWVKLYQSKHFVDEYPEDNQRFQNVTYTDDINHDREQSLEHMRKQMLSDFEFSAAVFVGGMGGIIQEFDLFQQLQPQATLLPVVSTGGAVRDIAERMGNISSDLHSDLDYVALFHRHLSVSVKEMRYQDPTLQPSVVKERYWRSID